MDSDEERSSGIGNSSESRREYDMDRMRSSASSPSTISTASSGSPLVRGHSNKGSAVASSNGGLRRPEATSIAAAQLQCQQQRMTLKSSTGAMKDATLSHLNGANVGGGDGITKPEKQPQKQHEANKSLGYNVAKSIAYRAHRFNELWRLNKVSYLNLACLLMTLVCLITIVLLSTSSDTVNQQQQTSIRSIRAGQSQHSAARKLQSTSELTDQEAEPIPEPSGQSLLGQRDNSPSEDYAGVGGSRAGLVSASMDYPDDDLWPPARKSNAVAKLRRKSGPEREAEESVVDQSKVSTNESSITKEEDSQSIASAATGSILEPILSQIFKDLELGSMFKAALNGTNNQMKPIIKRSKNGATIIISSSFNESSLANNETNRIPSLLQKLLPPLLFKQHSPASIGASGPMSLFAGDNLAGSATITISGRAIEPPASPFFANPSAGLFPFLDSSPAARPFRAFFPEPMAIRMNSLISAPSQFAALPYPSALGMMLRSMAADPNEELSPPGATQRDTKLASQTLDKTSRKLNSSEPLSTQASQPQAATLSDIKLSPSEQVANNTRNSTADPEVETFDVSQLNPFKASSHRPRLFSPLAHHSVMVLGSGSAGAPESFISGLPGQLTGNLPMPMHMSMPHMMMLGSGSDSGPLVTSGSSSPWSAGGGNSIPMPFNPILRAILGSLAGGSSRSINLEDKNKTGINRSDRNSFQVIRPVFLPLDTMESLPMLTDDAADDRQTLMGEGMRQMIRARHRADMMMDDMESLDGNGPDFLGLQQDQQPSEHSTVSGVIRQTISGPEMTLERIIEVPSSAAQQPQQVPRGVQSQSISRLVENVSESGASNNVDEQTRSASSRRQPLAAAAASIDRRDDSSMEGPIGMMPHRMGFISKLLSDLSRRASGPKVTLSRSDLDDHLIDDSGEVKMEQSAPTWGPKIRVASARVRIRPSSSHGSEAVFLSPIPQQHQQSSMPNQQDNDHDGLFENTNEPGKQASLEDTLNSMEDRLDKVLSMATQYASTPSNVRAIITPIERPKPVDHEQLQSQVVNSNQVKSDNPYTSPTSPLFGFPASSSMIADPQQSAEEEGKRTNSREPRSFTYHSNNELASDFKSKLADPQRRDQEQRESDISEMRAEAISRASKFGPFFAPPAGAMGRRLDDGPFGELSSASLVDEQQSQQQETAASISGPTFLEGRAMMPVSGNQSKKSMTAESDEASRFRTIVV